MKLINTDCLAENSMLSIEDNNVDMILADLPYGVYKNKYHISLKFISLL